MISAIESIDRMKCARTYPDVAVQCPENGNFWLGWIQRIRKIKIRIRYPLKEAVKLKIKLSRGQKQ